MIHTLRFGPTPFPDPSSDPLYRSHRPDWPHLFGVSTPDEVLYPALEELVIEGVDAEEERGIVVAPSSSAVQDEENGLGQSWDRLPTPPSPLSSKGVEVKPNAPDAKPGSPIKVSQDFSVTWIGQRCVLVPISDQQMAAVDKRTPCSTYSTCYIQLDGLCILTDPIFSERTIDSWFAPSRLRPVPCALRELLKIDVVLVSHSHFDVSSRHRMQYLASC